MKEFVALRDLTGEQLIALYPHVRARPQSPALGEESLEEDEDEEDGENEEELAANEVKEDDIEDEAVDSSWYPTVEWVDFSHLANLHVI